jgi:hypothetical protein
LTKENENLIYELQNSDNVEAAWSNEGKIFAKIQPSGAIIRIFHDTDHFFEKRIKQLQRIT